jgi:hypothetical protein
MNKSEKFWNKSASKFDQAGKKDEQTYIKIIGRTKKYLKTGDTVPDSGCGTGLISNEIDDPDIQNISHSAREKAQQKAKVDCFFISGLKADGAPYSYSMHKNAGISGGAGPMGSIKSKIINIPIPRSKKAYLYHQIGFLIKGIFFVLAIIAFKSGLLSDYNLVTKTLISTSVVGVGGLITMITYHLLKISSKFFFSKKYPLVIKYKVKGYKRGFHPMISTTPVGLFAYLFRLIF